MRGNSPLNIAGVARGIFPPPVPPVPESVGQAAEKSSHFKSMVRQLAAMSMETLRMYTPLPRVEAFHASSHQWRILDGANQSSKTSSALVELARAACGCDPHGKYPKGPLLIQIVGLTEKELANPLFSKLFKPGAFSMIKDEKTRLWRFLRMDKEDSTRMDPYDAAYREKWESTPPIIPARMVKSISWRSLSDGVPSKVTLTNGTTMEFISSRAKPRRGNQVHVGLFDEDLEQEDHVIEFARGAMRFQGKGIWSATPQTMNETLQDLREAAERGEDHVHATLLLPHHNPFIPEEDRRSFLALLSEEQTAVRHYGRSAVGGKRIYTTFDPKDKHTCEPFKIPDSWAVYCVLDPGRAHIGCIMAAVPPDESHVYIYQAWEGVKSHAGKWAGEVLERSGGRQFQAYIIDRQAGVQTPMMYDTTVADKSWESIVAAGIEPVQRGPLSGFIPGSNNVRGREEALKAMFEVRGSGPFAGTPRLKIFRGRCGILEKQTKRARTDVKDPEKRFKQTEDVLVCMEYLAAYNPRYKTPPPRVLADTSHDPKLRRLLKRNSRRRRGVAH